MTDNELIFKVHAISAVFIEYLISYEPIYQKAVEKRVEAMPRHKKRETKEALIKNFKETKRIINNFAKNLENSDEKAFDECIDYLHEALNNVKITIDEKQSSQTGQ